ncbi:MAG: hypothetical protein QF451_12565, partial [Nitrospinota bacterium]|nr:hypothetical protein [Nitrospinota bacterium]
ARLDEGGSSALLQISGPVNRYPDFVRSIVQRLKTLCPTMGTVRIADTLCGAGVLVQRICGGVVWPESLEYPAFMLASEIQ